MRCPTCKLEFKLESSTAKPFCSERCRLIDLGHWLDESYSLPEVPNPEADEVPDDNWSKEPLANLEKLVNPDTLADTEESTDV